MTVRFSLGSGSFAYYFLEGSSVYPRWSVFFTAEKSHIFYSPGPICKRQHHLLPPSPAIHSGGQVTEENQITRDKRKVTCSLRAVPSSLTAVRSLDYRFIHLCISRSA